MRKSSTRLQQLACARADAQSRRIPWQRLLEARNQYIDWQEFYLWVRSILEIEQCVPDWLALVLNERCPGFLKSEKAAEGAVRKPLPFCLEGWIDDNAFGFAKLEGWFNAVQYYAIRDPRYQRAEVHWSECIEHWKQARPIRYPSFEEWKTAAAQCDETAHLLPDVGRQRAAAKWAPPHRLADAVSRYFDWEAFAYWARPALESGSTLPAEVARQLQSRCPGFLESIAQPSGARAESTSQRWNTLMYWIADHFFQDAKKEGWYDAILAQVRNHPRAIRTAGIRS